MLGVARPLSIVSLFLVSVTAPEASEPAAGLADAIDVLVDGEHCRGAHVTTRPHNRKLVYHAPTGTWFVFHGTGHWSEVQKEDHAYAKEVIAWRSSKDGGTTWSKLRPAIVGNGHSSSADVLLLRDRIFVTETRWAYWRRKAGIPWLESGKAFYHRSTPDKPMFYVPFEVFPFVIDGTGLVPGQPTEALPGDKHVAHAGPHYGSMTRDTEGYFWVAARLRRRYCHLGSAQYSSGRRDRLATASRPFHQFRPWEPCTPSDRP